MEVHKFRTLRAEFTKCDNNESEMQKNRKHRRYVLTKVQL